MGRVCCFVAVAVVLIGQALPQKAFALGMEAKGNAPFSEKNYSLWEGIMPVVNDKARVYKKWINGSESLYFKGSTNELNATLTHFAKVQVQNHVVVFRPGPGEVRSFDHSAFSFNWKLHVLRGIARSQRATDDAEDLQWQKDPVLTVYVDKDIDLDKVEIPEELTLRKPKVDSEQAEKYLPTQQKIDAFLEARNATLEATQKDQLK